MKPFRTLAIETSTRAGSVALLDEEGRVEEAFLDAAAIQGRALAPCMEALLRKQGIGPDAVDLVAVGLGPGSYTGLRVSIALAKTFAYAAGCALKGVSSFAALAQAQGREGETLLTVCKAGRSDFYHALFRMEQGEARLVEDHAVSPMDRVVALARTDCRVLGEGADLIRQESQAPSLPTAGGVALLGRALYEKEGPSGESEFLPLYLRRSNAELNWEKNRARKQGKAGEKKN
jgi:tRNA threonylcarbamoyladenosine biosynthesis protein TsaB